MEPGGGTSPDAAQSLHQDPQQGPASVHVQEHLNDEKMRMCVGLQQWRSHLEQMHLHSQAISSLTEDSKVGGAGGVSRVCVRGCVFTHPCVCGPELPEPAAAGPQSSCGEGEQQREVHQPAAGASDPGVPQRSGQTAAGKHPPTSGQHLAPPAQTPERGSPAGARALPADQRTSDGEEAGAEGGQ